MVDPAERRLGVGEVALEDCLVAEPLVEIREDDDVEARRVVRPVVRLERQDPELSQLAVTDLVGDLARLHVALGIIVGRLHGSQSAKSPGREFRVARDRLHRDNEGVPAEERHEPRNAGRRDVDAAFERRVFEAERIQVPDGLLPGPLDCRVRSLDGDRREGRPAVRAPQLDRIAWQGRGPPAAVRAGQRQPLQAGVPDALRRDPGDEDEPAVGVLGRRIGLLDGDDELAPERRVDVRRPKVAARPEPAGVDLAAPDELVPADVEDVGEIGVDRDLDRQANRAAGVVHDVEVFVDTAADGPINADGQRLAVDRAGVVEERLV